MLTFYKNIEFLFNGNGVELCSTNYIFKFILKTFFLFYFDTFLSVENTKHGFQYSNNTLLQTFLSWSLTKLIKEIISRSNFIRKLKGKEKFFLSLLSCNLSHCSIRLNGEDKNPSSIMNFFQANSFTGVSCFWFDGEKRGH